MSASAVALMVERHEDLDDSSDGPLADDQAEPFGLFGLGFLPRARLLRGHAEYSLSLEQALAILECFNSGSRLGIADIAAMLGMGRSTVHRYAATLAACGWLEQDAARKYRLGSGAMSGGLTITRWILRCIGDTSVFEQLRDWTGHTVTLGALDGHRVTFVRRWHAHGRGQHEADLELRAGAHVPLHCTALGKALLAGLNPSARDALLDRVRFTRHTSRTIRSRRSLTGELEHIATIGVAFADEELAVGVRSVAVALKAPVGPFRLAVGVDVPVGAGSMHRLRTEIAPFVRSAVERLERIGVTGSET